MASELTVAEVISELTDEERARWVWRGLFGPRLQHAGLLRRIAAARIAARTATAAELARVVALAEGEAARRVFFSVKAEKNGDLEAARDGVGGVEAMMNFAAHLRAGSNAYDEPTHEAALARCRKEINERVAAMAAELRQGGTA